MPPQRLVQQHLRKIKHALLWFLCCPWTRAVGLWCGILCPLTTAIISTVNGLPTLKTANNSAMQPKSPMCADDIPPLRRHISCSTLNLLSLWLLLRLLFTPLLKRRY